VYCGGENLRCVANWKRERGMWMLAHVARAGRTSVLRTYLAVTMRWLWLLGLCTVIAAGGAFAVSMKQPRVYRATTLLTINQQLPGQDAYSGLLASDQLVVTYMALIRQPVVLARAAGQAGGISAQQLAQRVTVQNQAGTQIIQVSVDDTSRHRAAQLANAIAAAFIAIQQESEDARLSSAQQQLDRQLTQIASQIRSLTARVNALQAQDPTNPQLAGLQQQLDAARARRDDLQTVSGQLITQNLGARGNVLVFQPAVPPLLPDHPNVRLNTAIAGALGLVIALCLVFLLELLDNRIRTTKQIEELTGIPVIAQVGTHSQRRRLLSDAESHRLAGSYRTLRTNLSFLALERPLRTIVVTSALPGEGKTTVAINLAVSLAQSGQHVLLVDADLHQPTIHERLGLENTTGLSLCLLRAEQRMPISPWPVVPHLSILTAGPKPPNPAELLGSGRMRRFLDTLVGGQSDRGDSGAEVDVVVIDSPPAAVFVDAAVLAGQADGTILVMDGVKSRAEPVLRAKDTLTRMHARILGVVLNRAARPLGAASYDYICAEPVDERAAIPAEPVGRAPGSQATEALER
jgi:capsular exopolysaccharide synthesis family protein